MNRFFLSIACVVVIVSGVSASPVERTIINGENLPLRYVFVPRSDLSLIGFGSGESPDREDLIALLAEHGDRLQQVAPGGMWRISGDPGILVGMYSGGASGLRNRLIFRRIDAGISPITIGRDDTPLGRDEATLEAWEVPGESEPVILDGLDDEWRSVETVARYGAMDAPARVEHTGRGGEIPLEETTRWRVGGTGIREIASFLGERWWYVAVNTTEAIDAGTFYHARLYPDRGIASSAGQVVIPVEDRSGPVVFSASSGRVTLVGQYVRRGTFLEAAIDRNTFEELMPFAFDSEWSIDIAVSAPVSDGREHFTVSTVFLNEIPRTAPAE
ncbi:MAG: hypothetical protein ACLFR8_05675 [Alkalispirochaeta sp.]